MKIDIISDGLIKETARASADGNFDDLMTWAKRKPSG
jgi:hypothetical protein